MHPYAPNFLLGLEGQMGWPATLPLALCSHYSSSARLPPSLEKLITGTSKMFIWPILGHPQGVAPSRVLPSPPKSLFSTLPYFILFVVSTMSQIIHVNYWLFCPGKYKLLLLYSQYLQWYLVSGRCSTNSSEWKKSGREKRREGENPKAGSSCLRN